MYVCVYTHTYVHTYTHIYVCMMHIYMFDNRDVFSRYSIGENALEKSTLHYLYKKE